MCSVELDRSQNHATKQFLTNLREKMQRQRRRM